MTSAMKTTISEVLNGLRFPAERWQIITYADDYGLDAASCNVLRGLPLRQYRNPAEVASVLASQHRADGLL